MCGPFVVDVLGEVAPAPEATSVTSPPRLSTPGGSLIGASATSPDLRPGRTPSPPANWLRNWQRPGERRCARRFASRGVGGRWVGARHAAAAHVVVMATQRARLSTVPAADRLMTVEEVSNYLQVPIRTLYRWRVEGEGPLGIRIGKYVRYRRSDLDSWLADRFRDAR